MRLRNGMHGKELPATLQLMGLLLSSLKCKMIVASILCASDSAQSIIFRFVICSLYLVV